MVRGFGKCAAGVWLNQLMFARTIRVEYEENGRKLVDCDVHTETESGERRVEGSATLVLE